jgi:peptidoglycan/LPS O-acetylase OafA/YrhL
MKLLNHLSRITTAGRTFIPQIDGLRFIAIMVVIAYHILGISSFHFSKTAPEEVTAGGLVANAFAAGHFGVQLFFAISGFILSLPFAKYYLGKGKPIRLGDYFVRRITRIEPPYIIHLVFLFFVCALVLRRMPSHPHLYHNAAWANYASTHILASLIYANGFIFGAHPYPNIVLWSLEIEVQFYILAPFLARVFAIQPTWKRRALLVSVITLMPLLVEHWGAGIYIVGFSLLGNIQYFLIGFLLADFYLAGWLEPAFQSFKWDFAFPLAGAAVILVNIHFFPEILLPWIILLSCLAAFRGKLGARLLSNPWITTIGGMCYTIYMYHCLMIASLIRGTLGLQTKILWLDLLIQFLILTPIVVLVCSILFALFERPFMQRNWHTKVWATIRRRNSQ